MRKIRKDFRDREEKEESETGKKREEGSEEDEKKGNPKDESCSRHYNTSVLDECSAGCDWKR